MINNASALNVNLTNFDVDAGDHQRADASLRTLSSELSLRVDSHTKDGMLVVTCPVCNGTARISDHDVACDYGCADAEWALRQQAAMLPIRCSESRSSRHYGGSCPQCVNYAARLREVTTIIRERSAAGEAVDEQILVDGIPVDRSRFDRIKRDRLVYRLADRAAREEIEIAEISALLDQWVSGDTLLDIQGETPLWGPQHAPLTAAGQQTLLAGPDGVGKSTLCGQYAKARLNLPGWGEEMLGLPVVPLPDDQTVLYLAADRPVQIMQNFRRGLTDDMREVLRDRLTFWPGPPPVDLGTSAGQLWLLRNVERVRAGLVFIDSRKDVGDVMEPREVSRLNQLLKQLDADGVEVFMPAHTLQAADNPSTKPELTHVKGQREVFSGTGSVLMIKGRPGADEVVLHQVKPIREFHPPLTVRFDKQSGRARVVEQRAGVDTLDLTDRPPTAAEAEAEVRDDLLSAGSGGLSSTEVTGTGRVGTARRAARDRMRDRGEVISRREGRALRWWLPEFAPED